MGKQFEKVQTIDWLGTGPVDLDTDQTADYISVENFTNALATLYTAAGTAGDDWNWTFKQATDAAGSDVKDWDTVAEYWIKQAATNLQTTATWTRNTQTADALVSGDATSAEQVSQCQVDLDFSTLDTNNGFNFISCTITLDASGGAQYGLAELMLYGAKKPQASPLGALA